MGRFIKELKYSIGLKKHLFFILLIGFVACGAAWLFQDTLREDLKKAFPGTYDADHIHYEEEKYLLSGDVKQRSPQVTDADLKAEIQFNENLRSAGWSKGYEEIATEYMQIASYLGPDSAVKGYGTDDYYSNKDIDSNGSKYTTVQTIWMDEDLVKKFKLGTEATTIYGMPNNYLEKIYVVLGYDYSQVDNGYRIGNILKTKNSVGNIQMQVVGFLPKNATAMIGDKEVNLNSYILCPFISLKDVYVAKEETPAAYTDGIYVPMKLLNDDFLSGAYRNNPPGTKTESKTGMKYAEVRCLYIERSAIPEEAPDWLKTLANTATTGTTAVMAGSNYAAAGTVTEGATFDTLSGKDITKLQAVGLLTEGTTWNVYGLDIILDDYLVLIHEPEKKEEENAQDGTTPDGTNPEDGENNPIFIDEPETKEREFKVDERAKLFHYQVMMNRGYVITSLTRNEAQLSLAEVIENSWKDFRRDNPKKDPLTSYRISGASKDNSILYRKNSMKLTDQVLNFTKKGFPICMLLLAIYLIYKFYCGKEFYSSIYLTGTNRIEIMAMYLIEGALLVVLAAALSYGCAFVICKLLGLHLTAPKPVIRRICKLVSYPTIGIMIWILIRDFGRMFRRTQEV